MQLKARWCLTEDMVLLKEGSGVRMLFSQHGCLKGQDSDEHNGAKTQPVLFDSALLPNVV